MHRIFLRHGCRKLCSSGSSQRLSECRQIVHVSFSSILSGRKSNKVFSRHARQKATFKVATKKTLEDVVVPVCLKYTYINDDSGQSSPCQSDDLKELTGGGILPKEKITESLNRFLKRAEIRQLCEQNGLGPKLFNTAFLSFRRCCLESDSMPPELYVIFHDLGSDASRFHVDDLLPYFMQHAKKVYPHLECLDDLKKISDLRLPHNWYPEARTMQRKFILHVGPTNSGKTYQALKRFMEAETGVYCGPLKMLATEVYHRTNDCGVPCDLITGEERRFADPSGESSAHLACTIEMLSTSMPFEVAVIDEIQMLRDQTRGWAWTRALLGVNAKEVHVCGEAAAVDLVRDLLFPINEEAEILKYKRMSPLKVLDEPLQSLNNIRDGDCIVAFSKPDIYNISRDLEKAGKEVALIYGSLPPATKLAQAQKFNDPNNSCNVMVATDAIGMGLNLSIKRIIFWSLMRPNLNENGEKEVEYLSPSSALQIAGRAGRYGAGHESGEVTTFRQHDLPVLKRILSTKIENIKKAGLYPTLEQIEMFSFFLPNASLTNLMDIFVSLCSVDESKYFMSNIDDFKVLASLIAHVPNMTLKTQYIFCMAPVNWRLAFISQQFVKFARKFSTTEQLTWSWLAESIDWKKRFKKPKRIADLMLLESMFDVLDVYLWLGKRFSDSFTEQELVRAKQNELDQLVKDSVLDIAALLGKSKTSPSVDLSDDEEQHQQQSGSKFVLDGMTVEIDQKTDPEKENGPKFDLFKKGTLTSRLISQGLLTPNIVDKLRKEWTDSQKQRTETKKVTNTPKTSSSSKKKGGKR